MAINWLQRLAQNPDKSWADFRRGLGIFCIGAGLILAGTKFSHLLQIPGLLILVLGSIFAIRGYVGILAFRMTSSFKPPPSQFDKDI